VTELVVAAFEALGPGPTRRELALVARVLRESGDEETVALFAEPFSEGVSSRLAELAEQAGASGFVALDLYVEVVNPGAIAGALGR
jgi:hypothetical protein